MGNIDAAIEQLFSERERTILKRSKYAGKDREKLDAYLIEIENYLRQLQSVKSIIEYADGIEKLNK